MTSEPIAADGAAAPPAEAVSTPTEALPAPSRGRLVAEIWIVLGLSLGQSAVYAILRLVDRLTRPEALSQQVATLNPSQSDRPWLDLTYQLVNIAFGLVPVALALFLLAQPRGLRDVLRRIGLDGARPWRDLGAGAGLAALIGIPGLGLYVAGRALGLSVHISTSGLADHWWTIPVLVLAAAFNGVLEEVVVVAWLVDRLRAIGWRVPAILVTSAVLRGSYHLYQGPAMALGNVAMGLVLGYVYLRTKRVMPLVVAHTLLDVVSFLGPVLLPAALLTGLGIT